MGSDSTRSTSEGSTSKSSAERALLLERLAELEHDQWAHWTKYMLDNLTPENIARWRKQIETPYAELSEKEKDSDREWAVKVFNVLKELLLTTYTRGMLEVLISG